MIQEKVITEEGTWHEMGFKKACNCKGDSSAGRFFFRRTHPHGEIKIELGYALGPVCDRCDMPWTREVTSEHSQ